MESQINISHRGKNRQKPFLGAGQRGFTLIEMMITVAIAAILLTVVAPSFQDFFQKNRVKRAAEEVYGLVSRARAETATRDQNMFVSINSANWCVGFANAAGCDCTATNPAALGACSVPVAGVPVLEVVDGANFANVTMSAETFGGGTTFNRVRGTAGTGRVTLESGDWALDVRVSNKGRVRICSPTATRAMGYETCI